MKITTTIFLLAFFVIHTNVNANSTNSFTYADSVRPLKVGDQLPDLLVKGIEKYHKKNVRMSEFQGKYLLLDFWASGCVSCFSGFKKLVGFAKTYEKDFQAIIVNPYETKEQVKKRIANPKIASIAILPDLPTIIGDKIWDEWFPFPTLGQQVWIDRKGKIVGITNAYNVNPQTIEELIRTGTLGDVLMASTFYLDLKQSRLRDILDAKTTTQTPQSIFSSYYTGEGNAPFGLNSGRIVDSVKSTVRYSFLNHSFHSLFTQAIMIEKETRTGKRGAVPVAIYEMSSPSFYMNPDSYEKLDAFITRNSFCYEIEVPLSDEKTLPDIMWRELSQHIGERLNIFARHEKRPRLTYVLKLFNPSLLPVSTGGKTNKTYPDDTNGKFYTYTNTPLLKILDEIMYSLKDRELLEGTSGYKPLPAVVEVDSNANIDVKLTSIYGKGSNKNYFIDLKQQLKAIGVEILEEYRDTEVMVLYNK